MPSAVEHVSDGLSLHSPQNPIHQQSSAGSSLTKLLQPPDFLLSCHGSAVSSYPVCLRNPHLCCPFLLLPGSSALLCTFPLTRTADLLIHSGHLLAASQLTAERQEGLRAGRWGDAALCQQRPGGEQRVHGVGEPLLQPVPTVCTCVCRASPQLWHSCPGPRGRQCVRLWCQGCWGTPNLTSGLGLH